MTIKNKNLKSLDQFVDEKIGSKGTEKREQHEADYDAFKLGVLIQQAMEKKDLASNNWQISRNKQVLHFKIGKRKNK